MASHDPTAPALVASGPQQGMRDSSYSTFSVGKQHFKRAPCQDVFFGVLFWLHLFGLWVYIGYRLDTILNDERMAKELRVDVQTGYFPVIFSAIGIAFAGCLLW